jgi:ATP-dependent Clp protease ATP-binding subunit ClpC
MFERFTDQARRAVVLAQEEARMLNHDYIGTEHILLGLIDEGDGVAAQALKRMDITEQAVHQQVEETVGRGQRPARAGHIPFTREAKSVLQLSLRAALQLGDNYIDTGHILLGLTREKQSPAAQLLVHLGADPVRVHRQVIELLHGDEGERERETVRGTERPAAGGRGNRRLLSELLARSDSLESRLSALEHRVGTGPDVRDLDQQVAQVRRDKETAIDAQDFETAAVLRDREKELLGEKASRQQEWAAAHRDLPPLTAEVERLRELLRQHGIDPDPQDGAA